MPFALTNPGQTPRPTAQRRSVQSAPDPWPVPELDSLTPAIRATLATLSIPPASLHVPLSLLPDSQPERPFVPVTSFSSPGPSSLRLFCRPSFLQSGDDVCPSSFAQFSLGLR